METAMSRKQKDELPRQSAEPDERSTKLNEAVDRDSKREPAQPSNVKPRPTERPDLVWAEHED